VTPARPDARNDHPQRLPLGLRPHTNGPDPTNGWKRTQAYQDNKQSSRSPGIARRISVLVSAGESEGLLSVGWCGVPESPSAHQNSHEDSGPYEAQYWVRFARGWDRPSRDARELKRSKIPEDCGRKTVSWDMKSQPNFWDPVAECWPGGSIAKLPTTRADRSHRNRASSSGPSGDDAALSRRRNVGVSNEFPGSRRYGPGYCGTFLNTTLMTPPRCQNEDVRYYRPPPRSGTEKISQTSEA
jgi:hypothetical protein